MRKIITLLVVLSFLSCNKKIIDKPKNLLSKEKMSEIIADLAIYDQSYSVNPNTNMELTSRFVLQKHKTNGKTYTESYKYYLSDPSDLDDILEDAKEIILKKDSKLNAHIKKTKKDNPNLPPFVK